MSSNTQKKRYWKLLAYPDSAPEDWKEILEEEGQRFVCILHDKDVWTKKDEKKNPEHKEGELKKAHFHILLMFDGETSFNTIVKIAEKIKALTPEACNGSPSTFMRYMLHLDQKSKYKYPLEDLEAHNGAVIDLTTKADEERLYDEIFDYLVGSSIHNLFRLQLYARKNKPEWFKYIRSHTYAIACLITAKKDDDVEQEELKKKEEELKRQEQTDLSQLAEDALKAQENEVIRKLGEL